MPNLLEEVSYFFFKRRLRKKLRSLYELEDPWSSGLLIEALAPIIRSQMRLLSASILAAPILDAGGGEGHFFQCVKDVVQEYHLLDIEKQALERAREKLPGASCRLIHKSLDEFHPLPDTYGAIWLFSTLTYLGGPRHGRVIHRILESLWRSLKRGGIVLMMHPYYSEKELDSLRQYGHILVGFGGNIKFNHINELGKQIFLIQTVQKL